MTAWPARYLTLPILGLALAACEDDPLLPPSERDSDDGGSYAALTFDLEEPESGELHAEDHGGVDAGGFCLRNENPELF